MSKYSEIAKKMFYDNIGKFEYYVFNNKNYDEKQMREFIESLDFDIYCEEVIVEFVNIGLEQSSTLEEVSEKNLNRRELILHFISLVVALYAANHKNTVSDDFKELADEICKSTMFMILTTKILFGR